MLKNYKTFLMLLVALAFFTSCNEDIVNSTKINDFIGTYILDPQESYVIPFDQNGNPITSEKRSIGNETLSLSLGQGDSLILSSTTLGRIKAIPKIDGDKLRLTIPEQQYNGILNPTGENQQIKALDNVYFGKRSDGNKFFDAEPGKGRYQVLARGGKKYELQVRCCPRTS